MAVGKLGHTDVLLFGKPIDILSFGKPYMVLSKCYSCHKAIMVIGAKCCTKITHADDTYQLSDVFFAWRIIDINFLRKS